jgi:hypothetical protein
MLSHITTDLHQKYLEEVFKPQLGKPGASTPAKPTSSSDLDGDGETDSFEKKVRQFIYDVRHLMRKNNIPVERAFQMRSSKTNYGADVIKTAKDKLGIKSGGTASVAEETGHKEKLYSIVINYKNGTKYRKRTSRSEIQRLRSNPNVSSVEMTRYGVDGLAKKDYDGDGKIESPSKEHAGAVHNAIQRKMGGTPDGKDTRRTSKKKLKSYGVSEGFSDWRQDLKEVMGVDDEIASRKENEIKEKKVDNYGGGKDAVVKINPNFTEETTILGGHIVESFELDESYMNEVVNIATEFFYNCGLNENGVDIVIEELGEEKFNEFVFDLAEEYFLSESRTLLGKKKVTKKLPTGTKPSQSTKSRVEKGGQTIKSQSVKGTIGKKITASKVKSAVENAKETQAPSSEKAPEQTKKKMGGGIFGALRDRVQRDTELLKKSAQTARDVATKRGAEAKAVYDALRERGKKAEQSATATRARRKATVAAGRAVTKAAGAAGAAVGSGVAARRRGASAAGVAGAALGAGLRKLTKEEIELQEKAESEQQQKLFGLALSVKRGETSRDEASAEVLKIVDSMSEKKIRDFAKTPHSEVPKRKVSEAIANPEGVTTKQSPRVSQKQKDAMRKQVEIKQQQYDMGEERGSVQTQKQISARNLELRAEKMRVAADQQAMQQQKKELQNKQQPETQNNSYEPEGEVVDELTRYAEKTGKSFKTGKPTSSGGTMGGSDTRSQALRQVMKSMGPARVGVQPRGQKKVSGQLPPRAGEPGGPLSPAEKLKRRRDAAKKAQEFMSDTKGT